MANRRLTLFGLIGGGAVVVAGGITALALHHPVGRSVVSPLTRVGGHPRTSGRTSVSTPQATAVPLMLPVNAPVQNAYGWQYSGALNEWYFNPGITIAAKAGTPVRAAWAGTVTKVSDNPAMGMTVTVSDGDTYTTVYGHLGKASVKAGQRLSQGMVLGTVGGNDIYSHQTGSHVDFQVYRGTVATDPETYLHPSS